MNTTTLLKSIAILTAALCTTAQAAPKLEIIRSGNFFNVRWLAAETDWRLQSTTSLKNGPWADVLPVPPVAVGYHNYIAAFSGPSRFFRLACSGTGIDLPDASFDDTNCDGIDGDASQAIFVSRSGSDTNPGTRAFPVLTISRGITLASSGKDVYVGKGTYYLASTVRLLNGVSIYGQYDPDDNWSRSEANETIIAAATTAVRIQDISSETHVEGFTIRSANPTVAGESSYGVRIVSCSGPVIIRYNTIEAGYGAAGTSRQNANNGAVGGNGANGTPGNADDEDVVISGGTGGTSLGGSPGGKGGNGGMSPGFRGGDGAQGTGGTAGGTGANGGDPGGDATAGWNGANGLQGASGIGGPNFGSITNGFYDPADGVNASAGSPGHGGGGGGGGGGQTCFSCDDGAGNGGGGGGGGGGAGLGGLGGGGGGGSFGVLVANSTATITDCKILTRSGGAGGKGGNGGLGVEGGQPGLGASFHNSELGDGAQGGRGGHGGHGGGGGGGGGGPSFGIQRSGGTVTITGNTYTIGTGGAGGAGGSSNPGGGFAGAAGLSAQVH